jgi:hypothetical protein
MPTPLLLVSVFFLIVVVSYLKNRFDKPGATGGDAGIDRYLVGPCPQCGSLLEGHDWAMFACTVASQANDIRVKEFLEKAKARDWQGLRSFSDWEGDQNDLEAYVVRCSSGGVVLIILDPFELFDCEQLYMRENVSADEMLEIQKKLRPTSWHIAPDAPKLRAREKA